LLLHGDCVPGDIMQEREADSFAAEFLTPGEVIRPELPPRMDLKALEEIGRKWGVSVDSLVYRCREVGTVSEPAYRRAYQRLQQLRKLNLFAPEPIDRYPGEVPIMIARAFALAESNGLTMHALARELAWPLPRLRLLWATPRATSGHNYDWSEALALDPAETKSVATSRVTGFEDRRQPGRVCSQLARCCRLPRSSGI
jgi:hypothetical protein